MGTLNLQGTDLIKNIHLPFKIYQLLLVKT